MTHFDISHGFSFSVSSQLSSHSFLVALQKVVTTFALRFGQVILLTQVYKLGQEMMKVISRSFMGVLLSL